MFQKYLVLIFLLLISLGLDAQLILGVTGGGHISGIQNANGVEYFSEHRLSQVANYNGGVYLDYTVFKNFSVELGLFRTAKGAKMDENLQGSSSRDGLSEGFWLDYLQVPLLVKYHWKKSKVSANVMLGGYYGHLRQAYYFYPSYEPWMDKYKIVLYPLKDGFAKKDFGVKAGLASSYPLSSRWHVGLRIFSEWGVHKIMWKNEEWAGYNRSYGGQLFLEYVIWEKQKE